MAEPAGQPHHGLSHLDVPRHLGPRPFVVPVQPEPRHAGKVPANRGVDGDRPDAAAQFDAEPHAVRKRRRDHPPQDRPLRQSAPFDLEFGEPGPPALELVDLLYPVPELVG
jgi:hypothetical protein